MKARSALFSLSLLGAVAVPMVAVGASSSGQDLYTQNCAMCHGANGKGAVPGAPDFTKAGGVLAQSDSVLSERIINGYQSKGSPMAMPPMKGQLNEHQVHEVLEYLHKTFGVAAASGSSGD